MFDIYTRLHFESKNIMRINDSTNLHAEYAIKYKKVFVCQCLLIAYFWTQFLNVIYYSNTLFHV